MLQDRPRKVLLTQRLIKLPSQLSQGLGIALLWMNTLTPVLERKQTEIANVKQCLLCSSFEMFGRETSVKS